MEKLLNHLRTRYPSLQFRAGDQFLWSPESSEIVYQSGANEASDGWSLLHETSHALLGHLGYGTDFELLKLEVAAWEHAKQLAHELGLLISDDHVQDCLDTYRDWLYARSICPRCGTKTIQEANLQQYHCFNCHEVWRVTPSRFCRAYRASKRTPQRKVFVADL